MGTGHNISLIWHLRHISIIYPIVNGMFVMICSHDIFNQPFWIHFDGNPMKISLDQSPRWPTESTESWLPSASRCYKAWPFPAVCCWSCEGWRPGAVKPAAVPERLGMAGMIPEMSVDCWSQWNVGQFPTKKNIWFCCLGGCEMYEGWDWYETIDVPNSHCLVD